jgi:hypothetical protein
MDRTTMRWMICISVISIILSFLLTTGINAVSDWNSMLYGYENSAYRTVVIEKHYQAPQGDGWRGGTSYYNQAPRQLGYQLP